MNTFSEHLFLNELKHYKYYFYLGSLIRRLGVHVHLRGVGGNPGPVHQLCHWLAYHQRGAHLQVGDRLPGIVVGDH